MVMNRMLLDAGLPPTILREPEQLFARGAGLAGIMIHEGQNVYRKYVPKIEEKNDLILWTNDLDDDLGIQILNDGDKFSEDNPLILLEDPNLGRTRAPSLPPVAPSMKSG